MLSARNIQKKYGQLQVLKGVDINIKKGEIVSIVGSSGAGKSTLMKILATLLEADSGSAHLGDLDVLNKKEDVRKQLGYLPQEFGVYPKVGAFEMLNHIALLKGITTGRKELVNALLQRVNLYQFRKKALSSFSGGMKQRFGIAQALIGDPNLIIVDEPTAGLDPGERHGRIRLTFCCSTPPSR
jgi:ABC-type multidrug transport system ATPase subunit